MAALKPHKIKDVKQVQRIFDAIHDRDERFELNLYIVGKDEDDDGDSRSSETGPGTAQGSPGSSSPERSPNT